MVKDLLAAEYDRRARMEGRGSTIVTTSASLLTVVFGLTVVVTGEDYVFANCYAVFALLAALLAFVISAVLGIGSMPTASRTRPSAAIPSSSSLTTRSSGRCAACPRPSTRPG
jgi:uncharacterized membrane protein